MDRAMRNAIVFINICIAAAVTMLLREFESTTTLPASNTVEAAVASAALGDSMIRTSSNKAAVAALKSVRGPASRMLSGKDYLFVNQFITEMSRERMTSLAQARMASQRGTSRDLKDYGAWMVINQQRMLDDLKRIAKIHKISVPQEPSSDELSELEELHGKKFDARYIKMMSNGYKRDLKLLERAGYSADPEVQVFAARYLSITRDNFAKLQKLRRR